MWSSWFLCGQAKLWNEFVFARTPEIKRHARKAQKGYFGSFFFFLDLAGTVSLVLDIPWLFNDLFPPENHAHIGMASGAKAARGVS